MNSSTHIFDDQRERIIAIPIIAFLIALLSMSDKESDASFGYVVVIALVYTTLIWEWNRYLFILFRQWFPVIHQTLRRVIFQSIVSLITTVGISSLILLFEAKVLNMCVFDWEHFTQSSLRSLMPTLIITIIYEARYYFIRWKVTMQEAEQLKQENLAIQLQGLKNQVSPHFLFNSLNTLAAIIPENADQAVEFVQQLSRTYRYLLEQKDKNTVDLLTELEFIKSYYFLQKIRFGDNLNLIIDIPKSHHPLCIPPLSLQLLFENAIKHNIISDQRPLDIRISSKQKEFLTVSNTLQPKWMVEPSTGIGLSNIQSRYRYLGDYSIQAGPQGGHFIVNIPLLSYDQIS